MIYIEKGSEFDIISSDELKSSVYAALEKIGSKNKVLTIPPDFTRYHSRAGEITTFIYEYFGWNIVF